MMKKLTYLVSHNLIFFSIVIIIVGLAMPFVLQYCYLGTITLAPIDEQGKLGPISDWISGIFTPCIALASFILLYITYIRQSEELELSREQIIKQNKITSRQQFESTFFQMISLYRENLAEVQCRGNNGKKCIKDIYDSLLLYYKVISQVDDPQNWHYKDWAFPKSEFDIISYAYETCIALYNEHQDEGPLEQAFETLYSILQLINDADFEPKDKSVYIEIFRSQLSRYEFIMLYYDSLIGFGRNRKEIWRELGIFRKGNFTLLMDHKHYNLYDECLLCESPKVVPIC